MAQPSSPSSRPPTPSTHRLRTPPVIRTGAPISVVMRGHRIRVRFGMGRHGLAVTLRRDSSPTPTSVEPSSSSLLFVPGRQVSRYTYSTDDFFLLPVAPPPTTTMTIHTAVGTVPQRGPSPDLFYTPGTSAGSTAGLYMGEEDQHSTLDHTGSESSSNLC